MSWIERVNNINISIKMGDGRIYTPLWRSAKRSKNYNHSAYNFINKPGTLIDRREPEGYQYDLELYFIGDNHLDLARNFEISADDKRFWTITHPYYDEIKAQPLSIQRDNNGNNATVFRVKIWETISSNYPIEKLVVDDSVTALRIDINNQSLTNFSSSSGIDSSNIGIINDSIDIIDNEISPYLSDTIYTEFKNIINTAKRVVNDNIYSTIDRMRSVINAINYPISVVQDVQSRINIYKELQAKLSNIIIGQEQPTSDDSYLYELIVSSVISGMLNCAITPNEGDYITRGEVVDTTEVLREQYALHITTLEGVTAVRSDIAESFTPDQTTSRLLNDMQYSTLANLYDQVFSAKQERYFILENDSNPIVLAHRFYGLDEQDENIQFFIDTNNLTIPELIQIKKGRNILYYQ